MKSKCYFLIAGAAVAGFAVWYQDFDRRDYLRRETLAAERAQQRAADTEQKRIALERAFATARKAMEDRRTEREARAQREALAQAQREEWQSQLSVVREETAARRVNRERLAREVAEVEQHIVTQQREHAAITREDEFLQSHIFAAHASVARLGAVAEKAEKLRIAAATPPEPTRRPR